MRSAGIGCAEICGGHILNAWGAGWAVSSGLCSSNNKENIFYNNTILARWVSTVIGESGRLTKQWHCHIRFGTAIDMDDS